MATGCGAMFCISDSLLGVGYRAIGVQPIGNVVTGRSGTLGFLCVCVFACAAKC